MRYESMCLQIDGGSAYVLASKGIDTLQDNCHCFYSHRCNPNTGVIAWFLPNTKEDGSCLWYLPSVVEISAVETAVTFTEENAVASITPTSITVVIGEGTTSSDQTLTYTVTVNNEEVTVTGSTEFVTTFTFQRQLYLCPSLKDRVPLSSPVLSPQRLLFHLNIPTLRSTESRPTLIYQVSQLL